MVIWRQAGEEILDGAVEEAGLVQVGSVAGLGDRYPRRTRDLARHIVGGGEKMRVVGPDQHQGRHRDLVERADYAVVGLGEHAARRTGETPRRSVLADADLVALPEGGEAARLEVAGALLRPLVPCLPGLTVAEARPG